jgi:hypothetical protein
MDKYANDKECLGVMALKMRTLWPFKDVDNDVRKWRRRLALERERRLNSVLEKN